MGAALIKLYDQNQFLLDHRPPHSDLGYSAPRKTIFFSVYGVANFIICFRLSVRITNSTVMNTTRTTSLVTSQIVKKLLLYIHCLQLFRVCRFKRQVRIFLSIEEIIVFQVLIPGFVIR